MKCTNCGNDNPATLWDEGDTIYCSVCTHRTRKTDFEDDSVQCPYCHRREIKRRCIVDIAIPLTGHQVVRQSLPKLIRY